MPGPRRPRTSGSSGAAWHFIAAFATAKLTAQYSQAKLGQIWQIMTPLLNATVYYFIFGVLMDTRRGVEDFVPFLVTGVFIWTFTSSSITAGTRAISGNIGLVRALHFPRASLPVALALQQLQQLLFSLGALTLILLVFGQYPRPSWLLAIPALALQALFNTGLSMVMARLTARTPDIAQLTPFVLRTWMYSSGVMWSLDHLLVATGCRTRCWCCWSTTRRRSTSTSCGTRSSTATAGSPAHVWAAALGWALLCGVAGFVYFWKAEETYGRG